MDKTKITTTVVGEVSKDMYKDIAHPIFKEIGSSGESLLRFVALPFKFLGLTAEQLELKYATFIKQTLNKVDEKNLVSPKAVIAAPLLDHIKFVFDEDGLTEMFSELLSKAMDTDIEFLVHPAFVEMLKQMSPLDVEFLHLFFETQDAIETDDLKWSHSETQLSLSVESMLRLGIINAIDYEDRNSVAITLTSMGCLFRDLCMLTPSQVKDSYIENFNENDSTSEENLMFSDWFSTMIYAEDNTKLNIRQRFDYSDVKHGAEIIVCLRVNNVNRKNTLIEKIFFDDGKKTHTFPIGDIPYNIEECSYKDFIFKIDSKYELLSAMTNEHGHFFVKTKNSNYSFKLSYQTQKEISIFINNLTK